VKEALGIIGALLAITAYLPQIVSLLKTRQSEGIDLRTWFLFFVAAALLSSNAATSPDLAFKLQSFSNLTLVSFTLLLVCGIRNQSKIASWKQQSGDRARRVSYRLTSGWWRVKKRIAGDVK